MISKKKLLMEEKISEKIAIASAFVFLLWLNDVLLIREYGRIYMILGFNDCIIGFSALIISFFAFTKVILSGGMGKDSYLIRALALVPFSLAIVCIVMTVINWNNIRPKVLSKSDEYSYSLIGIEEDDNFASTQYKVYESKNNFEYNFAFLEITNADFENEVEWNSDGYIYRGLQHYVNK